VSKVKTGALFWVKPNAKTMREELDTARQFAVQLAARDKCILEIVGIESLVENKEKKVDFFLL